MEHLKELAKAAESFSKAIDAVMEASAPKEDKKPDFEANRWYNDSFSQAYIFALEPFDKKQDKVIAYGFDKEGKWWTKGRIDIEGCKFIEEGDLSDPIIVRPLIKIHICPSVDLKSLKYSINDKGELSFHDNDIEVNICESGEHSASVRAEGVGSVSFGGKKVKVPESFEKVSGKEKAIDIYSLRNLSAKELYENKAYRDLLKNEGWNIAYGDDMPKKDGLFLCVRWGRGKDPLMMISNEVKDHRVTLLWRYAPINPFSKD